MSILRIELAQCRNMLGPAPTNEPPEGWEEQARRDADAAAGWARDIAHDARGDHRLVKAARDLMRQAQKAALR